MIVKFSGPGVTRFVDCDTVSSEVVGRPDSDIEGISIRMYRAGKEVRIDPGSLFADQLFTRAYVMDGGKTVEIFSAPAMPKPAEAQSVPLKFAAAEVMRCLSMAEQRFGDIQQAVEWFRFTEVPELGSTPAKASESGRIKGVFHYLETAPDSAFRQGGKS